ncbi:hypothetical protein LOZ56_000890 [Ophidiomyces ophidiicola]|nr:hypothetical protein LOZ56_000890 [Ophidiomyces ophidiicola]KAI2148727.1 hypothetical protein LOZ27_001651 [Ophidiomyces ophidiicola]KAI2163531.1 hypothetical protein LOZ25_001563 [Ophidiomyces ophidiicola]
MNNGLLTWRVPWTAIRPSFRSKTPPDSLNRSRFFCRHWPPPQSWQIAAAPNVNDTAQRHWSPATRKFPLHPPKRPFNKSSLLLSGSFSKGQQKQEEGTPFQSRELSHSELSRIFGTPRIPPAFGNRILRVLHGRRVAGTLDLDLPPDIVKALPQHVLEDGLKWLRVNFPLDEDAAIIKRIEREEQEEEEKLIKRAEDLGLYKPQSGRFGAEIEKEGDVYGRSILQEIRRENEKVNKRKDEDERREWLESEAKEKENLRTSIQRSTELAKFEASALEEGANMCILWFVGTKLHDEVGRGNFLALYLSAGVFSSITSLMAHVLGNKLTVTSLGASGAISGLVAAWCLLHSNDKLTIAFLPRNWQEMFSANGSTFLAVIVLVEIITLVSPFRIASMDHWAHLGGYATGAVVGWLWKEKRERDRKKSVWQKFLDGYH